MNEKPRILIIDDGPDLVNNLRHVLQDDGCIIDIAEDGQSGLALCRNTQFNMAFINSELPDMLGNDAAKEIAHISPETECVIVAGSTVEESAFESRQQEVAVVHEIKPSDVNRTRTFSGGAFHSKQTKESADERKKYRQMADLLEDAVYEFDSEMKLVYANRSALAISGYTEEDLYAGVHLPDMVKTETFERIRNLFDKDKLAEKASLESWTLAGIRLYRKDGSPVAGEATITAIAADDGTLVGYFGIGHDSAKNERAEWAWQHRIAVEELVASLSTHLSNLPFDAIDEGIHHALQAIGGFAGADRSYVFLLSDDGTRISNTHEWCSKGTEPQIDGLKDLPIADYQWLYDELILSGSLYIPCVATLPLEASAERENLLAQDIQSLALVPIFHGGAVLGFLGFDWVQTEQTGIIEEDLTLLKMVGEVFSNALTHERTEAQLRASEVKYLSVVEQANDAVLIAQDYRIKFANSKMAQFTRYSVDELTNLEFQKLLSPGSLELVVSRYEKRLSGENPPNFYTIEILDRDGALFPVEVNVSVIEFEGRPAELVFLRDVSERREAQEALRRERDFSTAIISTSAALIFGTDTKGTVTIFNNYCEAITKYKKHEVFGKNPLQLFVPEKHWDSTSQTFKQIAKGEISSAPIELPIITKEGEERIIYWNLTPIKDELERISSVIGIGIDVTEQRKAERALRESEEKYHSLFNSTLTGTYVTDFDGTILETNECGAISLGFDRPDDLIGENILDFYRRKEDRLSILTESQKGATNRFELDLVKHDGTELTAWITLSPLELQGQRVFLTSGMDVTDHKRRENALRASEERFRELCDLLPQIVFEMDMTGNLTFINHTAFTTLGYTTEEFDEGLNAYDTIFPEYRHRASDTILGELSGTEHTVQRKDGSTFPTTIYSTYIIHDNEPVGIRGIIIDITERKLVEQEIRAERDFSQKVLGTAASLVASLDRQGRIIYFNTFCEEITGWTSAEVMGKRWTEILSPKKSKTKAENDFRAIVRKGKEFYQREQPLLTRDGEEKLISWNTTSIRNPQGKITAAVIIGADITERKKAEDEILQRNQELTALNTIAATMSQSFDLGEILDDVLDKVLNILSINNGGIYFLDKETEELTLEFYRGKTDAMLELVSPLQLGVGIGGRVAQSGETMFVESLPDSVELIGRDIQELVIRKNLKSIVCCPLWARGSALGVMYAITEGERIFTPPERDLLTLIGHQVSTAIEDAQLFEEASRTRALEELDRLRTEILASVSHELRTPLTAIKGLSSSLVQPDIEWDSETQRDFLATIDQEADKLTHLVNDLLEMSQLEAGVMNMEKRQAKISAIMSQLSDQLKALVSKHSFEINIQPDMPSVHVDEIRIGQVIANLVANAASYSTEGTPIILEATHNGQEVVVSVKDKGIGIPQEHLLNIFDRFYRLESGVARRRGGTGLGLSICKGIIESHEGRIWVESEVGKGSKFSFSLPEYKPL